MSNEYDGANAYAEFLSSKFRFTQNHGFTVSRPDLNPLLKPHQADVVCWNVLGALPATFMTLAPGSHHPDVWHDVNRMITRCARILLRKKSGSRRLRAATNYPGSERRLFARRARWGKPDARRRSIFCR